MKMEKYRESIFSFNFSLIYLLRDQKLYQSTFAFDRKYRMCTEYLKFSTAYQECIVNFLKEPPYVVG